MPIYTRTGDTGSTSLFGGKRVLKCHELVEVYGSLDELNSWLGYLSAVIKEHDVVVFLSSVQSDLFTIGGFLAGWRTIGMEHLDIQTKKMESIIDSMETSLPKLENFILPGGLEISSFVHIARSICRRVERQTVALQIKKTPEIEDVSEKDFEHIIRFLNRLSDLLFVTARFINKQQGVAEITWSAIDRAAKKK